MARLSASVRCAVQSPCAAASSWLGSAVPGARTRSVRREHFPNVGTRLAGFILQLEDEE
jgi:hypothetical protein